VARLIAVIALATGLLLAPAAADARRHGCKVRHAKTIEHSRRAVVFQKVKPEPDLPSGKATFTYGCMFRVGRIRRLPDNPRGFIVARRPKLAGRYVGFEKSYEEGEFGFFSYMVVLDLRNGHVITEKPATSKSQTGTIFDFVLKLNGSVAWVGRDEEGDGSVELWKVDRQTSDGSLLDTNVDVTSLRLSGDRRSVLWRKGDAERSVPID
jgi:hypothetical protein